MAIKAILFDHDGTLVDSEAVHYDLWQKLLQKHSITIPKAEFEKRFVGLPSSEIARDIIKHYRCSIGLDELIHKKTRLVKQYLSEQAFPLIGDALEVIIALKQLGFTLGVVTGASQLSIATTIERHNLSKYFDVVVCGEDVDNNKPAPDPYRLAVKKLGLQLEECVAVEDSETGLQSAIGAGLKCLTVETPLTPHHDLTLSTQHCPCLTEVKQWILDNAQ